MKFKFVWLLILHTWEGLCSICIWLLRWRVFKGDNSCVSRLSWHVFKGDNWCVSWPRRYHFNETDVMPVESVSVSGLSKDFYLTTSGSYQGLCETETFQILPRVNLSWASLSYSSFHDLDEGSVTTAWEKLIWKCLFWASCRPIELKPCMNDACQYKKACANM